MASSCSGASGSGSLGRTVKLRSALTGDDRTPGTTRVLTVVAGNLLLAKELTQLKGAPAILLRNPLPNRKGIHNMQPGRELKQSLGVRAMAAHLGVSPTRVRQLIGEGRLPATQVSGRWVLDARSRFGQPLRRPGRPLEPRNAWGLLLLAEGRLPEWLDRSERSR